MFRIKVMNQHVTKVRSDILILGIFRNVRPLQGPAEEVDWIHGGLLSHLIMNGKITGEIGESTLLAPQRKIPASKVLIVGLGDLDLFSYPQLKDLFENTFKKLHQLKVKQCAMEVFGLLDRPLDPSQVISNLLTSYKHHPISNTLELSLLVRDENKAYQVQQHLSSISVTT